MNSLHHHPWDVSLDPHTVPVFLWLQWAHRRSLQPMQPALARYGLSSAEFDLLATLRNAEPDYTLTPSQLLEQMLLTSGGLSKVMAQLEARGLIARLCRDDDRRIKPVRLTTDGQGADRTSHGRRRGQGRCLAAHGAEWGRTDPTDGFVAAGGGGGGRSLAPRTKPSAALLAKRAATDNTKQYGKVGQQGQEGFVSGA